MQASSPRFSEEDITAGACHETLTEPWAGSWGGRCPPNPLPGSKALREFSSLASPALSVFGPCGELCNLGQVTTIGLGSLFEDDSVNPWSAGLKQMT